ncbi:fungalysin metallopeptidase (M36) [Dokdonia sp. MED134]|uniref:M36 family metallopeptidase n=1 Tax=Dokdonia sp. MED134 TaxID=313590 RepID=UPI000068D04D|nr:M36 family metallopeptidase [Dokdonia sp. MED134]EAQ39850.1 fungalysin metallopeptidase (M36) [Dokdonia sp. MED134]
MITKLRALVAVLCLFPFAINAQSTSRDIDKILVSHIAKQQLKPSDIAAYQITSEHTSSTSGIQHIYFRQTYNGIEVIGTESSVHVKNGKPVQSHINFYRDIETRVKSTSHIINETAAIQSVVTKMGYTSGGLNQISYDAKTNTRTFKSAYISRDPIPVKKVYTVTDQGALVATWELFINETQSKNWYNFFVDATNGDILSKKNRTLTCTVNHDHSESAHKTAFAKAENITFKASPPADASFTEGTYTVYPLPLASPFDGDRSQVSGVFNAVASPFGWHDTNGITGAEYTVTRGNNVNAYEDGDNPGFQPDGGAGLFFDYPLNTVFSGGNQSESAAITNLFYWNNVIHDVLYQYGFDEASGNYQENNYDNGGVGNDQVNAEAQDSSGECNANFSFSPDGVSGRMQMYTCGSRDGDLDNLVIIHEYGHGISTRLTGGAANSDCLFNDEQMGEGWSDWYGAVMTIKPEDVATDLRPVGNWLFEQGPDDPGIRDFPYTTDLSQDPRTYNNIQSASVPHGVGSVWAAMLWEMTWNLIEEYGFDPDIYNGTGGNNIAIALVTEGLKLQPCNPGFIDGRDAILAADLTLYGGANQCRIWDAFAKRGLGLSASQGSSFSRFDGIEAFDSPSTSFQLNEEPICLSADVVVLGGGLPTGGIYSGPGVTDNGDGQTFTFDPTIAGINDHVITYVADSTCDDDGGDTATATLSVKSDDPIIVCQDITVTLDAEGNAQIAPQDVVTNFSPGDGYTIDQSGIFSPENITGGTTLNLSDDETSGPVPLGFDFSFFGETYSTAIVSSNGFLTFENNSNSGCCSGEFIPSQSAINNYIAFAWSDLFPPGGNGIVRYTTIGAAPNRVFVLDFIDISLCCDSTPEVTTQLKLFEDSSVIEIHTTEIIQSGTMSQGIENADGTEGYVLDERNSTPFTLANDFIAFIPNAGDFPDNCGNATTVTLDIDTFTCSDLGENTVTATATDSEGNTSSCTATVTIISDVSVTFEQEEVLCADQTSVTLGGGLPTGGVYSGTGVIDDGNGQTFTIDPSVTGEGSVTVSYESENSCGINGTAAVTLEIIPSIPDVTCQDITVSLNDEGVATVSWEDIFDSSTFTGNLESTLYALNPNSGVLNIAEYQFNQTNSDLELNSSFNYSTGLDRNYGFDKHPETSQVYLVASEVAGGVRSLYRIDLNAPSEDPILISNLVSSNGSNQIVDITFDNNGNLYGIYNNGELEIINTETGASSPFTFINVFGAIGITYDFDNDRLLYATGTGPVNIYDVNISNGSFNNIGTFLTPGPSEFCSAQALEYIGNDTLMAGATSSCDILYEVNLTSFETSLLANPTGSYPNIKDLLLYSQKPLDNCTNEPLTLEVSPSTFDCSNLGENVITLTATDSLGNTTTCTSTAIVSTTVDVTFTTDNTFCIDQGEIILGGGFPAGGVYSGPGVTDNNNGIDFTLNPSIGEGFYEITYSYTNACELQNQATQTIEIFGAIPDLECTDITVNLDENGIVVLDAALLLGAAGESEMGTLYALNPFSGNQNIAKYSYNTTTDDLILDSSYSYNTGADRNYGFDQNPSTGELYLLRRVPETGSRALYSIDLQEEDGEPTFISEVLSVNGSNQVQDMAFGTDGTLYMVFNGGEINSYDIDSGNTEAIATVDSAGAVGMTYDTDQNRLLYTTGSNPVNLFAIDNSTGTVTELFSFFTPGSNGGCSAQGIEYVGQGKVIASSTFGCDVIYTVDLTSQEANLLLNPTGSYSDIKDLMFLGTLPVDNCNGEALTFTVTPNQLDCSNIGENIVTVTATDADGNTSECTSTVTVIDNIAPVVNCLPSIDVVLDSSGVVTLTAEDLVTGDIFDNCDTNLEIEISPAQITCDEYAGISLTEIIENGSFENDLNFWTSTIENGSDDGGCTQPWKVEENSQTICCCVDEVSPTDGSYGAFTSFDGSENTLYRLFQNVLIPTTINDNDFEANLSFDWVANFDYNGTESRKLEVALYDNSGSEIEVIYQDIIPADGLTSRNESISLDLTATLLAYRGQEVTLEFSAFIPENFSGPAKAMIDNVSLQAATNNVDIVITVTDDSGNATSCTVEVNITDPDNVCGLSTEEFSSTEVLLFPNPASSSVQITWGNNTLKSITIYDMLGKLIFNEKIKDNQIQTSFDVSNLNTGIYLVQLSDESNNLTTKRLIVE